MAALDEDLTSRLFRVRKTAMQMLRDRGFIVDDEDIDMNKLQFIEKFGDPVDRDRLDFKKATTDPKDQIFVFFAKDVKFGVQQLRSYVERMKQDNVMKAIIVIQLNLTPKVKSTIQEVFSKTLRLEIFQEAELLVNISEHDLVPQHQLLTNAEKKALLERYTLKETQLPRILVTDPVARYYGLRRGQVVRIIRKSETAGEYITYRFVV